MTDLQDMLRETYLDEARELLADFEQGLLLLESLPDDTELLNRIFRCAHTLKGNSGMLGFDAIVTFTHALESLLDQLRRDRLFATRRVVDLLLASKDVLAGLVLAIGEPGLGRPSGYESVLEDLRALAVSAESVAGENPSPASAVRAEPPSAAAARAMDAAPAQDLTGSLRIAAEKIDELVNLVGEMVITQSMVAQQALQLEHGAPDGLREAVAQMDRHCRELQERVLRVRMVPVHTLFGRFTRMVRDVAASLGKEVQLEVVGGETELDRTVIERLGDPLTHLLRNAVDHGLEGPDERVRAGKPGCATISLGASQRGGSVFIAVADDGRGLDRARILARARDRGLVDAAEVPSDADIDALIFLPGFSTAQNVTELSGRGVGMDAVKRTVEGLKGAIAIRSVPGAGTTMEMKLPLTLAVVDGLVFRAGFSTFVAPLDCVVESFRPQRDQLRSAAGLGEMVVLRDRVLPLLRLSTVLGVAGGVDDPARAILVVLDDGRAACALLVDELLGQAQVVIKSLEANYEAVPGLAGATILGDGRVAMILDPTGLMQLGGTDRRARVAGSTVEVAA